MFTGVRHPDWTERWAHFIKDSLDLWADLKLDWSHINCTQFSGQGIEAITGEDPYVAGGWEGHFENAWEAGKEIRKRGFNTLDDVIADLFPEVPLAQLWPGDVCLISAVGWEEEEPLLVMPHGVALADPPFYYAVTPAGMGRGDLYAMAVRGFAVGREV